MGEEITFTVRPLIPSATALEGAFRVHIPTKDLELLGLKAGELCRLTSAEGNAGVGIAWRSTEQNAKPQIHPVKLTDTVRDAFGFKLGNHVTIQKSTTKTAHADRVVIVDVTDRATLDAAKNDENWRIRCENTLSNVEAIAPGVVFEVASRKGLKKRYLIEQIASKEVKETESLYTYNDHTQLIMQNEASPPAPPPFVMQSLAISAEGIGGLNKQIELLNKRLTRLIGEIRGKKLPPQVQRNGGILLYGPAGTGKSLLLNRISKAPWNKVVTIDQTVLGTTASKKAQTIRSLFDEALTRQPSLVMMDNLESIAGTGQTDAYGSLTSFLVAELDRLKNTQVLVVAATHNPNDIDKALRTPGRFRYEIEVPIPDMKSRVEILKAMHGTSLVEDSVAEIIGERTHGFVGQDLEALYNNALEHAVDRYFEEAEWVTVPESEKNSDDLNSSKDNSGSSSQAEESSSTSETAEIRTTMEEYERALLEVRPTAMKEVFLEKPNVRWTDIGGSGSVKETLDEVVEWPFKYPGLMKDLNVEPQKGILFYGPPGCSKTLTAKAIATSSGLNFIAVKGAELTSMYVGESERAVREVFRKARAAAPSIIFFDEIDSIGSERDSAGTKGLNVLTTLLNEMDGIESLKGVLVLAATNKPEILDPALLRPGRFDSLIYVAPPNEAARREILRIRTRAVRVAPDVDIGALAALTDGFSGAEVVNICSEAARATMRRTVASLGADAGGRVVDGADVDEGAVQVSKRDFDDALANAVRRITPEMVEGYENWKRGLSKNM